MCLNACFIKNVVIKTASELKQCMEKVVLNRIIIYVSLNEHFCKYRFAIFLLKWHNDGDNV